MKDVLEPTVEKEYVEAITEISQEMQEQAETRNKQIQNGTASVRVPAAITVSVSSNKDGGYCEGWISYYDGRKLYFYGTQTERYGLPFIGSTFSPFVMVLPYENLVNAETEYSTKGFFVVGVFSMTTRNVPTFTPKLPFGGAGIGSWGTKGIGKFTAG